MLGTRGQDHRYTLSQITSFLWPLTHQCSPRRNPEASFSFKGRRNPSYLPPEVWDYCHTGTGVCTHKHCPSSSQICLVRFRRPSAMKGGDLGVTTSLGWKAREQLPASHLWFPIPAYQRGMKCVRTKAIPVPLPQQLGSEVGNLPTGDSRLLAPFPTPISFPTSNLWSSQSYLHEWSGANPFRKSCRL